MARCGKIVEVLSQYDCEPYIHIRQLADGKKFYCHFLDVDEKERPVYGVVPIADQQIQSVKDCTLPLRELLCGSELKFLLFESQYPTERMEEVKEFDETALPEVGVYLYFEPPLFRRLAELLARYEIDEPHVSSPTLNVGSEEDQVYGETTYEDLLTYSKEEHSGDCIKMAAPCPRCWADEILHKARWITDRLDES